MTARPVQGALYRQCPCLSRLHIRFKLQKSGTFKNGGRGSACYDSCLDYGNISAKEKDFLSEDAANGLTAEEDAT